MPRKIKKLPKLQPLPELSSAKESIKSGKAKNKKLFPRIIALLLIVLIFAIVLLLFHLEIINNPFKNINAPPQLFTIKDDCSLIVGQLIHNIKDEDSCQQICKSSCEVRNLRFYSSEFKEIPDNCNLCNCYCN